MIVHSCSISLVWLAPLSSSPVHVQSAGTVVKLSPCLQVLGEMLEPIMNGQEYG